MRLDAELMSKMYRDMVLGRVFEERVEQLSHRGIVPGSVHMGIGEEAAQVGAVRAVTHEDYMIPSHRGHVSALAKGAEPKLLMAELLGKATGYSGGRSGSCHLVDASSNNLGVQGIIGAVFPVAVGASLTQKRLNTGRVVLTFFGDGASNQGTFHEGMNLSAVWHLPLIWVCVNNMYGMGTRHDKVSAIENIADRACAYNMPGFVVDGNDVVAVYQAVFEARERALVGQGPTLIECKTYRHRGHSSFDRRLYKPQEELEAWLERDPLILFEKRLREKGLLDDDLLEEIAAEAQKRVDEAEEFSLSSPEPPPEAGVELVFCPGEVMK